MQKIDYNDKKVLDSLGTGRSDGVFQLESAGMKNFMKELKPQSLEDVIAEFLCIVRDRWILSHSISVVRTIRIRSSMTVLAGADPETDVLVVLYIRSRLWHTVRSLAGYTLGRSDLVRRAMSKKKSFRDGKRASEFCLWK